MDHPVGVPTGKAVSDARKGECQGDQSRCNVDGCPRFGVLGREGRDGARRVKGCGDPRARGKRNRTKGDSKARRARKVLGLSATGNAGTRHEEHWGGMFRVEVKAGAQVGPIATRFHSARTQSEASKALGDIRPFLMIAMPDGTSDGIVLVSLEDFATIISLI
jgi:hypothetical protein